MKALIYIICSFIILPGIYSCKSKSPEVESSDFAKQSLITFTDTQFKTAGITFGTVERRILSSTIEVNGILDVPPQNLVTISALMGGFIKSTDMLQGMRVKKGQVIATLQNPEFITVQREYLENKNLLIYLGQDYKRQETMLKENVSAKKDYQKVLSEYNNAVAANGALEEKLRMINIKPEGLTTATIKSTVSITSPINGYITVVNINIGKFVSPQDVICEIVDTDHLHAELTVFEKDITKVKVGQKILFNIVNEDSVQRTAHVYLINHKISEDRTVRVHAHMDKEDPSLIPNMYLKAFIKIGTHEVNALPDEAIVSSGDKAYVFVKVDSAQSGEHVYKALDVKKGLSENGYTEVTFSPDIKMNRICIVVNGAYDILSKMNNIE